MYLFYGKFGISNVVTIYNTIIYLFIVCLVSVRLVLIYQYEEYPIFLIYLIKLKLGRKYCLHFTLPDFMKLFQNIATKTQEQRPLFPSIFGTIFRSFFINNTSFTSYALVFSMQNLILNKLFLQVNLCQKHLFSHQLTHSVTKDCSLIYRFNT